MTTRLLLLEDDAISAASLRAGLSVLPADVDVAGTVADARQRALQGGHALWLFDLHLPDGRGDTLLAELREAGCTVPALALCADDGADPPGFLRCLAKPIELAALRDAVRDALPPGSLPPWDDAAGLAALAGQSAALAQLRGLFVAELPAQRDEIQQACARQRWDEVRAVLHRLKAGCGFVGALPLLAAVGRLYDSPADAGALARFEQSVDQVLGEPAGV